MKRYFCKKCPYRTASRKMIRKHVKEEHGVRGLAPHHEPHSPRVQSRISASYKQFKKEEL